MVDSEADNDKTKVVAVLSKGTVISHYRIVEKIGSGGMGEVYLAEDTSLSRQVALKFLSPHLCQDADCRARFKREAQAAAKLNHPNIVTIHEVSEFHGRPFFAMEHIEGRPLREYASHQELSIPRVLEIGIQIAEGLQAAHERGVTHRDIKPANVLIDSHGRARILDFGLASVAGTDHLTKTGSTLGTIGYMSPEQARGEAVDARSDLFSLGVVLYEMVAGRQPFKSDNDVVTLRNITDVEPDPLARYRASVPDELQRITSKLLQKDPALRYQTAADVISDLRNPMATGQQQKQASVPRNRGWRLLIVGAVVALVVTLFVWYGPTVRQEVGSWMNVSVVPSTKHLAVLPFVNIGNNPENQAFCDGLLETMTSKLSQLEQFHGSLWVVPSTEVRQRQLSSVADARCAFGITLAVTGSIQRDGKVRITLNLVDARTDRQLGSKIIDNALSNVSALQDSVVLCLVELLDVESRPDQERFLLAGRTASGAAYDLYLQGRGFLQRYEEEAVAIDTAIVLFKGALKADSLYASAYAGLGEAYWRKFEQCSDTALVEQARTSCRRALELDSGLIDAHLTMGLIGFGTSRYDDAGQEFQRALKLDMTCLDAYRGLARACIRLKKLTEAEDFLKMGIAVKPDYWQGYQDLGSFYLTYGRNDAALRQLRKVVELLPEDWRSWNDLGALYYQLNRTDDARKAWIHSTELQPNYSACSNLGTLYYMESHFADAARMFARALDLDSHDYMVWANLASAYLWIPEKRDSSKDLFHRAILMGEELRAVDPRDPSLLSELACYYSEVGEVFKGQSLISEALALAPDDREIMVNAGLFYLNSDRHDSAWFFIKKAIDNGYPSGQIRGLPEIQKMREDSHFSELFHSPGNESQDR